MTSVTRRVALVFLFLLSFNPTAFAQGTPTTGLRSRGAILWADIGFQADVGGSLNSSGLGNVNGLPGEINANTWGERYDAALIVRVGVGYNLTARDQLTFASHWEQAESDRAIVGLLGGQQLFAKFDDQQGWDIAFGYRRFFPTTGSAKPFASASFGLQRVDPISAVLDSPANNNYQSGSIPFYDDSWVTTWRLGGGILWSINDRVGWQATIDLKHSGTLSDVAGLGQVSFERINDTGDRWTLPMMVGVHVKF
jgi:hypothetical protein